MTEDNAQEKKLNYDEKYRDKYNSLGESLTKGDFLYFVNELSIWAEEDKYDFKNLFNRVSNRFGEEGFGTVMDAMLLGIPKYALNEKGELREGVEDAVELLVSLGAEPLLEFTKSVYGEHDTNFVREVAALKDDKLLRYIFKANFWDELVDTENGIGIDFLHSAVLGNSPKCIEYLIKEEGFDVNKKYEMEKDVTALFYAVGRNKENAFNKLIECGANLHAKDKEGKTILQYLASEHHEFDNRYTMKEKEAILIFNEKVKQLFEITVEPEKAKRKLRTAF